MLKRLFFIILFEVLCSFKYYKIDNENPLYNYNKIINEAELAIVNSAFDEANQLYSSLYMQKKSLMFGKDLWNYALTSAYINDTVAARKCIINLIEKDFDIKKIRDNPIFKSYINNIDIKKIKKKISNPYLYSLIDSLHNLDQKYRTVDYMYKKYKKEIDQIDSTNSIILKKIFDEYGFPSEAEIGCNQMFNLEILLMHQCYGSKRLYNFSKYVYKGIMDGKIEPYKGAYIHMRLSGKDFFGISNAIVKLSYSIMNSQILSEKEEMANTKDYLLGYYKLPEQEKSIIENKRKEIGIGSIDDSRKKLIYKLTNDDCLFIFQEIEHYVATDKNQYNWFLNGFIIIKSK